MTIMPLRKHFLYFPCVFNVTPPKFAWMLFKILIICAFIMTCIVIFNGRTNNVALKADERDRLQTKQLPYISAPVLDLLKRTDRGPPIVVPKNKLIFFWNQKSACSYWKRIFQFIQGIPRNKFKFIHTPGRSGLRYLDDYSDINISLMVQDDAWLKATFVREPRERLLSAFLDKAVDNSFVFEQCNRSVESFKAFVELIQTCQNPHWESQVRLPEHYYNKMMIGYMPDISPFTEKLLKRIGAWNSTVEQWLNNQYHNDLAITKWHATDARKKILQYYTPDLEKQILKMYKLDYEVFGFNKSLYTT